MWTLFGDDLFDQVRCSLLELDSEWREDAAEVFAALGRVLVKVMVDEVPLAILLDGPRPAPPHLWHLWRHNIVPQFREQQSTSVRGAALQYATIHYAADESSKTTRNPLHIDYLILIS